MSAAAAGSIRIPNTRRRRAFAAARGRDRELIALEVAWCVLFAVAVYA